MSEDITRVIVCSQKHRDVALNSVIHLEENIADLEGKLVLTDGKHVTLDYSTDQMQGRNLMLLLLATNTFSVGHEHI